MARGTQVHRKLEEEVHEVVTITTAESAEDRWGLKLFNMYTGLRSLVTDGLTREFPVFGFMNGLAVRGIIDEISYNNPAVKTSGSKTTSTEGTYKRIRRNSKEDRSPTPESYSIPPEGERTAYISDLKTRSSRTLPTESQARATTLQLMSYHRLLSSMVSGDCDFSALLAHYSLSGNTPFSDSFLTELSSLATPSSASAISENPTLLGMWNLVRTQMLFSINGLGEEMGVSYRDQVDGSVFAHQTLEYEEEKLERHLGDVLDWWNGRRETRGVEIEEAWKCARCEFADRCEWRKGKVEELIARRRGSGGGKSGGGGKPGESSGGGAGKGKGGGLSKREGAGNEAKEKPAEVWQKI